MCSSGGIATHSNGRPGSGTAHDQSETVLLDVPWSGVDVSEDSPGRQELGHGFTDKVGHDQEEGLRDVLRIMDGQSSARGERHDCSL
jgi:hypothetical protein